MAIKYGPHGYLDKAVYKEPPSHRNHTTEKILSEIERSNDVFIRHYQQKYEEPTSPPIWMTAEILSFGTISMCLKSLKARSDRNSISREFGLNERIFVNVAHHLSYVRNLCAHYSRVWNRSMTIRLRLPDQPIELTDALNRDAEAKIYNTIVMIGFLLRSVSPNSLWLDRSCDFFKETPISRLRAMGFPDDWQVLSFWSNYSEDV